MTGYPPEFRANAVADYQASGDTLAAVAERHGISKTALSGWVNPKPNKPRGPWKWAEKDIALTGGRWVPGRGGVSAWVPDKVAEDPHVDLTDHQRRVATEEAMFTEAEARTAHAKHVSGCRKERTVIGERVYQRRIKRERRALKVAA